MTASICLGLSRMGRMCNETGNYSLPVWTGCALVHVRHGRSAFPFRASYLGLETKGEIMMASI